MNTNTKDRLAKLVIRSFEQHTSLVLYRLEQREYGFEWLRSDGMWTGVHAISPEGAIGKANTCTSWGNREVHIMGSGSDLWMVHLVKED